jgi:hypothetical protein
MGFISAVLHLAVISIFASSFVEARTRAPRTENEKSLLYWRYLCENQPQSEVTKSDHAPNSPIILICPSQNWKVHADGDQVREVVEDAKK